MTLYYNQNTRGFYDSEIHKQIPTGSVEITKTEHLYLLSQQAEGKLIQPGTDGRPIAKVPDGPSLAQLKASATAYIDKKRIETEGTGMLYTFPGNVQDVVQVRGERDLVNIAGLVTRATMLKAANSQEPIPFMAESNRIHLMTPSEIISLGVAVSNFISSLYSKAWAIKANIRAATSEAGVTSARVW